MLAHRPTKRGRRLERLARVRGVHVARALASLAVAGWFGLASPPALAEQRAPEGAEDVAAIRRFALVVGSSDGGRGRARLRYAGSDARALSRVLADIGGVSRDDSVILVEPEAEALDVAFSRIASQISSSRRAGEHVEFVFYYSGHSDEKGLLVGGALVEYRRLRQLLDAVPADVRVAILDSCASGSFTRTKGGKRRAPFMVGRGSTVKGHAYLTSSSADEVAQESDRVGGSFFTHYLVTGMRGAADRNHDRLVTLSEAYQFAYDETLARTEGTQGGAQHAAYEIQLAGTGDLVMTDLRQTSARLEIAADIGGHVYLRDSRGALTAELHKPLGKGEVVLALEPGVYRLIVENGARRWATSVKVGKGEAVELTRDQLEAFSPEPTVARGGSVFFGAPPGDPTTAPGASVVPSAAGRVGAGAGYPEPGVDGSGAAPGAASPGPVSPAEGPAAPPSTTPAVDASTPVAETPVEAPIETPIETPIEPTPAVGEPASDATPAHTPAGFTTTQPVGPPPADAQPEPEPAPEPAPAAIATPEGPAPEGPIAPSGEDEVTIPFNIGVGPGASTNAKARGKKITNHTSLSLGFNQVYRIHGVDLSLGASVIEAELSGFQASLGFNKVSGMARGLQSTLGANVVDGRMLGVQGAVGANIVNGVSRGVQAAVGLNAASELAFGLQAGLVNHANHLHGAQFGLFNHGHRLNGVSFGLINVVSREVKGAQFGLVNYAEEADASFALLPITRKGGVHGSVWTSDLALVNVALQLHARRTYAFFTAGVHPLTRNDQGQAWMYGLGFGGRIPIAGDFSLDIDNVVHGVHAGFTSIGPPTLLDSLRLRVTWKPHRYFGLYGGPTINAALDVFGRGEQVRPGYAYSSYADEWITVWPGFVFGIEL